MRETLEIWIESCGVRIGGMVVATCGVALPKLYAASYDWPSALVDHPTGQLDDFALSPTPTAGKAGQVCVRVDGLENWIEGAEFERRRCRQRLFAVGDASNQSQGQSAG